MSLGFPNWVLIDNGPNQGCSKIDWGEQWGASIGVLLIVYFVLIQAPSHFLTRAIVSLE